MTFFFQNYIVDPRHKVSRLVNISCPTKDTLEDVSLGQLGRLYIKTDSLSKLSLTEARRSLEGQNALPRTEQSFVFHIVEWKVLDSYNSACSAPYLQTKGK